LKVLRLPWILAVALLVGGVADARGVQRGDRTLAPLAADAKRLSHGRFQNLLVYVPDGTPTSVVLFLSGDEGWNAATDAMARPLAQQGAMVIGIDWVTFKANLEGDGDACVFPDGDLENLSHFVQAYFHSPTYLSPILVGVASGAPFVYAVLAQAPRSTFAAALTLGFCPSLDLQKPLCKIQHRGTDLLPIVSLGNPWLNLQGEGDRACPVAAIREFISQIRGAALVTLPKVGHGRIRQARDAESDSYRSAAGWIERSAGH
jgi:type IV secretory pathway VirJ component